MEKVIVTIEEVKRTHSVGEMTMHFDEKFYCKLPMTPYKDECLPYFVENIMKKRKAV